MRHIVRLLALTLLLAATGCGKPKDFETLTVRADRLETLYSDSLVVYLYGQTRITAYPFRTGKKITVEYSRDTVDFFTINDLRNNRIILPLVPDSVDVEVRMGKELKLTGMPKADIISDWYRLMQNDTISPDLRVLLESQNRGAQGYLMTVAAVMRYPFAPETKGLIQAASLNGSTVSDILGRNLYTQDDYTRLVYRYPEDYKGKKTLHALFDKDTMMVVSIMDGRTLSPKDTAFLQALDTLAQRQYFVLTSLDSLSGAVRKVAKLSEKTHVTADLSGEASKLVSEMNIYRLPTYLIVDSLSHVLYKGYDRDSLLTLLKALNDGDKDLYTLPGGQKFSRPRPRISKPIIKR